MKFFLAVSLAFLFPYPFQTTQAADLSSCKDKNQCSQCKSKGQEAIEELGKKRNALQKKMAKASKGITSGRGNGQKGQAASAGDASKQCSQLGSMCSGELSPLSSEAEEIVKALKDPACQDQTGTEVANAESEKSTIMSNISNCDQTATTCAGLLGRDKDIEKGLGKDGKSGGGDKGGAGGGQGKPEEKKQEGGGSGGGGSPPTPPEQKPKEQDPEEARRKAEAEAREKERLKEQAAEAEKARKEMEAKWNKLCAGPNQSTTPVGATPTPRDPLCEIRDQGSKK